MMCDQCTMWIRSLPHDGYFAVMPLIEDLAEIGAPLAKYQRAKAITDPAKLWRFMPAWLKHHLSFSRLPDPVDTFDPRQYIPGIGYMDKWPKIPGVTLAIPIREEVEN